MEFVAVVAILAAFGLLFYVIREPQKWNWWNPEKAPRCSVCGTRHSPIEECDLR